MGVTRYIRHHHIGLVALFVALTGTAYAGTQVASHTGNPQAAKAKKKKKVKRGPQGPANAIIVPVMDIGYSDSLNGDTAASGAGGVGCASGSFGVITYSAAGAVDDAGFTFVVP